MEDILVFVSIVAVVFGILQIILFFKLWGMTNDVKEMKNMLDMMLRKDFQQKKNPPITYIADPIEIKQGWGNDITEEDKNRAKSIIPSLKKDEVIIKLIKNNKTIVYHKSDLYELKDEEYQVIYN